MTELPVENGRRSLKTWLTVEALGSMSAQEKRDPIKNGLALFTPPASA
jgi:hypothetical protein